MYSYKRDPLTQDVLPVLEDRHNHCIDALRYACEGARKSKPAATTYDFAKPPSGGALIPTG
jgi:phage terminase large subunit